MSSCVKHRISLTLSFTVKLYTCFREETSTLSLKKIPLKYFINFKIIIESSVLAYSLPNFSQVPLD